MAKKKKHMGMYLTNNKNKTFELPVNPEEILINYGTDDASEQVVKLGEINVIGEKKLRKLTIESVLPVATKKAKYATAKKKLSSAQKYIDKIMKIYKSKKPCRFVLTGTKISLKMTIANFTYGFKNGNSDEYAYTLELTEYKSYKAHKIKKKKAAKKGKRRSKPPKKIGRGSKVIVNGRLHVDSYGRGPGQTERNATRKVNFIALGRACPYHVTTLSGGWRGWVKKSAVKAV